MEAEFLELAKADPRRACKAFWAIAHCSEQELVAALLKVTGQKYVDKASFLHKDFLMGAMRQIIDTNRGKNSMELKDISQSSRDFLAKAAVAFLDQAHDEIQEWASDFEVHMENHPEPFKAAASFLARAAGGELNLRGLRVHSSFNDAKEKLVDYLTRQRTAQDEKWVCAWNKIHAAMEAAPL